MAAYAESRLEREAERKQVDVGSRRGVRRGTSMDRVLWISALVDELFDLRVLV